LNPTNFECGNGILETGEECDDGNTDVGDYCSPTCTLSLPGWSVTSSDHYYGRFGASRHFQAAMAVAESWGYSPTFERVFRTFESSTDSVYLGILQSVSDPNDKLVMRSRDNVPEAVATVFYRTSPGPLVVDVFSPIGDGFRLDLSDVNTPQVVHLNFEGVPTGGGAAGEGVGGGSCQAHMNEYNQCRRTELTGHAVEGILCATYVVGAGLTCGGLGLAITGATGQVQVAYLLCSAVIAGASEYAFGQCADFTNGFFESSTCGDKYPADRPCDDGPNCPGGAQAKCHYVGPAAGTWACRCPFDLTGVTCPVVTEVIDESQNPEGGPENFGDIRLDWDGDPAFPVTARFGARDHGGCTGNWFHPAEWFELSFGSGNGSHTFTDILNLGCRQPFGGSGDSFDYEVNLRDADGVTTEGMKFYLQCGENSCPNDGCE
jgi:cysteine-rich repeat protein